MAIKNEPTIVNNSEVNINRAQAEHRATWMSLIYDEAKKAGYDAEAICRKAISRCGHFHGQGFAANRKDMTDADDFRQAFLNDVGMKTFEMEVTQSDHDDLKIEFHYCPLLSAWKKQGFDDETCAKLCDIAMDGDRGIAAENGMKLTLKETIAQGCPICSLHFHK